MTPIEFKEHNTIIAKDQQPYLPLPACVCPDGNIICCWKFSFKERLKLLFTGKLWHSIQTFNHPLQPQYLSVDTLFSSQ